MEIKIEKMEMTGKRDDKSFRVHSLVLLAAFSKIINIVFWIEDLPKKNRRIIIENANTQSNHVDIGDEKFSTESQAVNKYKLLYKLCKHIFKI